MKPFRKKDRGAYHLDVRWSGYPRIQVSTRTTVKKRAVEMIATLQRLRNLGRRDILGLIARGAIKLDEVHDTCVRDISLLDQRIASSDAQSLGPLVERWLTWLRLSSTLSPKTRQPYAKDTVNRYEQSWTIFFSSFQRGRAATVADITKSFLADFRDERLKGGCEGSTINRDFVALESFFRWAKDEAGVTITLPRPPKQKEPPGRFRWLTSEEISAVRDQCEPEWWILFALLINTGLRISEATALTWGDLNFRAGHLEVRRKTIGTKTHTIKNLASARLVFLTSELAGLLLAHSSTVPSKPVNYVFPDERGDRRKAYKRWVKRVEWAGIPPATIHDLRHTFAVHALMGGVLLPRLQKLLGHSSPAMTLRYAQHLPNDYFAGDAKLLSKSLSSEAEVVRPTLAVIK